MYVCSEGLLKRKQNEQGVEGNTLTNVCSKKNNKREYLSNIKSVIAFHKKLRQWSLMCAHNGNFVFMLTHIPYYIGSEEKVFSKKKTF